MSVRHIVEGSSQTKALVATTSKTTIFTVPANSRAVLSSLHIDTGTPTTSITLGIEIGEVGNFTEYNRLDAYDIGANGQEVIDLDGIVINAGADVNVTASANNDNAVFLCYTLVSRALV